MLYVSGGSLRRNRETEVGFGELSEEWMEDLEEEWMRETDRDVDEIGDQDGDAEHGADEDMSTS